MNFKKDKWEKRILVTGGAGFIGSNYLHYAVKKYPNFLFFNLDKLTYAGNPDNLIALNDSPSYIFQEGDITDPVLLENLFDEYAFDGVINFAAETHVDRSIINPKEFYNTNLTGTLRLLEIVCKFIEQGCQIRFHQISTDEVYGSIEADGKFNESSPYSPSSPYAASKAAADLAVISYNKTYGLDTVITNCSNNFGPYQFPEKLIPLTILKCLSGKSIPVYGNGHQRRDWLYVGEHCRAIDLVFERGKAGRSYNISSNCEYENLEIIEKICDIIDRHTGKPGHIDLIKFVADRPGHDRRYALDASRLRSELGWKPQYDFKECLETTVKWYIENREWLENCLSDEYKAYLKKWYFDHLGEDYA